MSDPFQIARGLELRRAETERIRDVGGGVYSCDYFIPIINPVNVGAGTRGGEVTANITFGVRFVEKPIMTYGFEMAPNQPLYPGAFPDGNVAVFQWISGRTLNHGLRFYDGATVAIKAAGAYNLSVIAHVSFTGKAVRNPAGQ